MNSGWGKGIGFAALLLAAEVVSDPGRKAAVVDFCVEVHAAQLVNRALDLRDDVRELVRNDPAELDRLESSMKRFFREREFQLIRTWEKAVDWGIELGFDPETLYSEVKMMCLENSLEYVDEQ